MIILKPKSLFPYLLRDILTFCFAFLISLYFFKDASFSKYEWIILFGLMFMIFMIEFVRKPAYSSIDNEFRQRFISHLKAYCIFIALVVTCYWLIPIRWYHKGSVIAIITGVSVLDFIMNFVFVQVSRKIRPSEAAFKNVVVAGVGNSARNVANQLLQEKSNLKIGGFIDCLNNENQAIGSDKIVGNIENINDYLYENPVDEIVIALPSIYNKEIQKILEIADYHGVRAKYILDYQEMFGNKYKITKYGGIDALDVRKVAIDGRVAGFAKFSFDKIFACIVLVFLSPVLLTIAALIKLNSPGPVFYCPVRIGRSGRPFKLYKFRSMRVNDSATGGTLSTQKDDPRVTNVGKFLRKYSLDELPQFINVLLGDMSVVGPRPHRTFLNRTLQESVGKYMVRHYVKPGITGWAQVNGWRGPTDTDEQRRQRTIHDLWYVENWSFWLDVKIIFMTVFSSKTHDSAF